MKPQPTDITVREVETSFEHHAYRTPIKFGGVAVTHATILNARVRVRTRTGREAEGSGSMPLSTVWAFPSKTTPEPQRLEAMKTLAEKIAGLVRDSELCAHPVELSHELEPETLKLAAKVKRAAKLDEPVPKLCTLVVFSPFDAALHDAYGKVHGRHVYDCYGAEWMNADIARYLDASFAGEYLDRYSLRRPKPRMPLYHLIGALDALTDADVKERLHDGLPNTLGEWIVKDQLTHLKIKLNGDNADWDVNRVLAIERVAAETQARRGVNRWVYSLDFNEQCRNVEYLLEVLRRVKEGSPAAFDRVAYVEQPTARDLKAHPENKMHEAAKLKPVVIDESLTDYETFLLAREQGYSGVALKACKGQGQALLMAAAAQKQNMFLCVQDLTCPGQSFLHSAGLAAHIGPVTAIEGNSRQYCPAANVAWAEKFPGVFTVRDGMIETGGLDKPGMGH
jgi:L-alanine-DL-glutamate epimerase-like enolase superfamily enzyme